MALWVRCRLLPGRGERGQSLADCSMVCGAFAVVVGAGLWVCGVAPSVVWAHVQACVRAGTC